MDCSLFLVLWIFHKHYKKKNYFVPILSLCLFVWLEILNWFWSVLVFFFFSLVKRLYLRLEFAHFCWIYVFECNSCVLLSGMGCVFYLTVLVIGTLHWLLVKILISLSYGFCVRLIWLHMIFVRFLICDLKLMTVNEINVWHPRKQTKPKQRVWETVTPPQQCHKLITSKQRRIEAVIKAKGAPTKYWVHIK